MSSLVYRTILFASLNKLFTFSFLCHVHWSLHRRRRLCSVHRADSERLKFVDGYLSLAPFRILHSTKLPLLFDTVKWPCLCIRFDVQDLDPILVIGYF